MTGWRIEVLRFGGQDDPEIWANPDIVALIQAQDAEARARHGLGLFESAFCYVARPSPGSDPVGFVTGTIQGPVAHATLWVDPARRSQGLGLHLLSLAEAAAQAAGARRLGIGMYDGPGTGFLEHRGYARVGHVPALVRDVGCGEYRRSLPAALPPALPAPAGITVEPEEDSRALWAFYNSRFPLELDGGVAREDATFAALLHGPDGPAGYAFANLYARRGAVTIVFVRDGTPDAPARRRVLLADLEQGLADAGADTIDLWLMSDEAPGTFAEDGYAPMGALQEVAPGVTQVVSRKAVKSLAEVAA